MKKTLLRLIAMLTLAATLGLMIPFSVSADTFDNSFEYEASGVDCATQNGKIFVFPNDSDSVRYIKADEYRKDNFKETSIFVFNAEGRLIEVGSNIFATGPQVGINVPAGGFMVAFRPGTKLDKCYQTAMGGGVLYNATMSVIHDIYGKFEDNKLKIEYNNPKKVPSDATSFLFVGNSSTYFNGSPLKFKALAKAAGVDIDVVYCTFGSAYLSQFADPNHANGQNLRTKLESRKYDYVVLQDAAKTDYAATKPQVQTLLPLIEKNGAEALLYMRYSAASTFEQIANNARKHYDNYTSLAKEFSLICAPAAEAFVICKQKYPDINLYADDGGHHSKEGSYLIACTWLMSYLGINPVGNSYTADMSDDMVKKLQECALEACTEGYFERENNDIFLNTHNKADGDDNSEASDNSNTSDTSDTSNTSDASENSDENSDGVPEPANKKLTWLYWLIGGIVLLGGIAAAVIISKKK